MAPFRSARIALGLALAGLAAGAASAEIYRWVDEDGRLHFTEDLSKVPADRRGEARENAGAAPGPSRVQGFEAPPAARAAAAAPRARAGRVHRIEVERAGTSMLVAVRINDRTVAPFVIDTGASYVLLPKAVADEAGVLVGADTRTMRFTTANGVVEHPVVTLDSVELGTARAEQVPASISDGMQVGLLGLSFFNRYTYQIDAAAGVVTLVENDLAESGALLGGRSEAQWRGEFEALRARMAEVELRRERTPSSRGRKHGRLDEEQGELERQLELLEGEADQARVPDAWRR
jgi:clan AA aspartic protease (TIGR02281 family)